MSTPKMAPDRNKLGSSSMVPQADVYRGYGIQFQSPEENELKDRMQVEVSAIQPIPAERRIRSRVLRLEILVATFIVGGSYFIWRTQKHQQSFEALVSEQGQKVDKLVTSIDHQDDMVANVTKSVNGVTKMLTEQIGGLANDLQARNRQMDTIQSRLRGLEVTVRNHQQTASVRPPLVQSGPPTSVPVAAPAAWAASPQHPHRHDVDTSLKMPDNVTAHRTLQGEIDYWLASRLFTDGQRWVKVQPFGVNAIGVKVHNMEDGMDYILTPIGQWTAALEQQ